MPRAIYATILGACFAFSVVAVIGLMVRALRPRGTGLAPSPTLSSDLSGGRVGSSSTPVAASAPAPHTGVNLATLVVRLFDEIAKPWSWVALTLLELLTLYSSGTTEYAPALVSVICFMPVLSGVLALAGRRAGFGAAAKAATVLFALLAGAVILLWVLLASLNADSAAERMTMPVFAGVLASCLVFSIAAIVGLVVRGLSPPGTAGRGLDAIPSGGSGGWSRLTSGPAMVAVLAGGAVVLSIATMVLHPSYNYDYGAAANTAAETNSTDDNSAMAPATDDPNSTMANSTAAPDTSNSTAP